MKTTNIDLGKYDLNKLLRNPSLIHQIQDSLEELREDDLIITAIKRGAKENIVKCIEMIISQYKRNPKLMTDIIGTPTLQLIAEFEGVETIDDLPEGLYQSHALSQTIPADENNICTNTKNE